jgi:hypothetical protein
MRTQKLSSSSSDEIGCHRQTETPSLLIPMISPSKPHGVPSSDSHLNPSESSRWVEWAILAALPFIQCCPFSLCGVAQGPAVGRRNVDRAF